MPDLKLLREDVGAFAEAIGAPLTDAQLRLLRSKKRIVVGVAPRQGGKSRTLAVYALWRAFRERSHRALIVSASEDAARRLLAEVRRLAAASPLLSGSVADELSSVVRLSNGSEIRSTPASERQIRGWTADTLLLDEGALIGDDLVVGAAIPTTAARPDAHIVAVSSATVASGWFYDFVQQGEAGSEHVEAVRWGLAECPWITPTVVAALRSSMSPTRFAAEMEGTFASGSDALFTRSALERVTADYPLSSLETVRGPARLSGGIDWGMTTDQSAIVAFGRVPRVNGDATPRFAVVLAHAWPSGHPTTSVVEEIAGSPTHWHALHMETNGLGGPLSQALASLLRRRPHTEGGKPRQAMRIIDDSNLQADLRPPGSSQRQRSAWARGEPAEWSMQLRGLHTSGPLKAAAYGALRLLVDRGQVVFPASATELLRQLLLLRIDLTQAGAERIEASRGHDDLPDAAMLALGPEKRGNAWSTKLERFADTRKPQPQPVDLPADVPTVKTGGGIELPAFSIYQSVAGPQVTGMTPNKPKPIRVGGFIVNTGVS